MHPFELHAHLRDALTLAPGDVPPRLTSAPAPPWTSPMLRFAWDRMWSWAQALDGKERALELLLVPVWWAVSEELWDRCWEPGVLAVEGGLLAFVRQPSQALTGAVRVLVTVTDTAAVVGAAGWVHAQPLERQMGPFGVLRRVARVEVRGEAQQLGEDAVPAPELGLDPWTQVVVPRVRLDGLDRDARRSIELACAALSDLDGSASVRQLDTGA